MLNGRKILAIIPARGGSKGLPNKNILTICGKPLIAWTIEKAKLSNYIDKIVVSTDSREIAEIAKKFGISVPFLRPSNLSTDRSPTIDAVLHVLDVLESQEGGLYDYITLLEPTSPLRENNDIDQMLELLIQNEQNFDSIVSIGEVDVHPSIVKKKSGLNLQEFCQNLKKTTRRQDNEPAYFPYGVAYISKVQSLKDERTFYTKRCTHYTLKKYQNFEIDDIYGFWCVEAMMMNVWGVT